MCGFCGGDCDEGKVVVPVRNSRGDELEVGTVVALLSGGPEMTVVEFFGLSPMVRCMWFVQGMPYSQNFPLDALTLID